MGLVALLVLMSAEVGLGAVLGRSVGDQLASYGSLAGTIGLAAQVIFALLPVIQMRRLTLQRPQSLAAHPVPTLHLSGPDEQK